MKKYNLAFKYKNFFQKRSDFPKFKSKKSSRKSYSTVSTNGNIRIEDNSIKLPKLGLVKIKLHRAIPQNYVIKSATISREPNGAYYVSVLTEFVADIVPVPSDKNIVGLDFSMKELFVSSEDQRADYPRFFRKLEAKLAKAGRELSRKVKFSSNWNKANMLQYKAMFCGKQVIKVDKWFPSSKTCSVCRNIKTELALSERVYRCEECNSEIDRDLNASINIREAGRTLLAY